MEYLPDELWRPVPFPAYAESYEVSNHGRVRRINAEKCRAYIMNDWGYPMVQLYTQGKSHTFTIHRLVANAFLGPKSDGMHVNHKDGIKTNNAVWNLEFVTPRENLLHSYAVLNRQSAKGSQHAHARLTETDIPTIYTMRMQGLSPRKIAQHFDVHQDTIRNVLKNTGWKHISRPSCDFPPLPTKQVGEKHGMAKLHDEDVIRIRQLKAQGMTYKQLGKMFRLNVTYVCDIVKKRSWKHLP